MFMYKFTTQINKHQVQHHPALITSCIFVVLSSKLVCSKINILKWYSPSFAGEKTYYHDQVGPIFSYKIILSYIFHFDFFFLIMCKT